MKGEATYNYYSEGKLIKVDCRRWNGWLMGTVRFEYDRSGRVFSARIEKEGQAIGSMGYINDDTGNMETETWQFSNG